MWQFTILVAILILLSSLDETLFDFIYYFNALKRKIQKIIYKYPTLNYETLCQEPEKKIAIMVACWQEHLVIGKMLKHNASQINYENYNFFVGMYPNDQKTQQAVSEVQKIIKNIYQVVTDEPGPTSKADNLNCIYKYIQNIENKLNVKYEILVFHDSEDIIHPLSLKLYNYLIPRKDMIQIPVFPLEINYAYMTHWTYNDEFAENHTKKMTTREIMGGLVPSAGVGTAFSRETIDRLADKNFGKPFNIGSLTEDYSISLRIHLLNLKTIFLTQKINRVQNKRKWIFFGPLVPKNVKELVATRALFPTKYGAAIRQRSRWIMGITFQEWHQSGWPGNFITRYTLLHDRKAIVTHLVNFFAYLVFIYWVIYYILGIKPTFREILEANPTVNNLVLICTCLMAFRLYQRASATYQIYGFIPALLSIPRAIYSNLINFHALLRAYLGFFRKPKELKKWDKTDNAFPSMEELSSYRKKLGDLLIEAKIITPEQLTQALALQKKENIKLGNILIKNYAVSPARILSALAVQYDMQIIDLDSFKILEYADLKDISLDDYNWLIENKIFPILLQKKKLTLAINNPSDIGLKEKAKNIFNTYELNFVLASQAVSGNLNKEIL